MNLLNFSNLRKRVLRGIASSTVARPFAGMTSQNINISSVNVAKSVLRFNGWIKNDLVQNSVDSKNVWYSIQCEITSPTVLTINFYHPGSNINSYYILEWQITESF